MKIFQKQNPSYSIMGLPLDVKAEDIDESGGFKGWGSTFGGNPDAHGDIIVKGAFKDTIAEGGRNRNGIAMLYQHNPREPIGIWTKLEELDKGLYVEGELILDVQTAKEAFSLMRRGAIKGLSIGYDIPRLENGMRDPDAYEIVEKGDSWIRFLKRLELWEISLVTFPANIGANVTTVKDFENCRTERDWERALREAGLSNSQAKMVVKQIRPSLREAGENKNDEFAQMLLQGLQKRNQNLSDL
jgi:HK97 family phage prohead protease